MTTKEFAQWMAAYKLSFLGKDEDDSFVLTWRDDLESLEFQDALAALGFLRRDTSFEKTKPRLHIGLLLAFAKEARLQRQPGFRNPYAAEPKPKPQAAWNTAMLRVGIIDQKEFNRRERERAK